MPIDVPGTDLPDLSRADEVLHARFGRNFDEGDNAGDTKTAPGDITPGQDIELLGMVVKETVAPEEDEATSNGASDLSPVATQVSTRSEYTTLGGDDEIPAGVMAQLEADGAPATANGLFIATDRMHWISPDRLEIASTTDIDEGTSIEVHYELQSVPDGDMQVRTTIWMFVREL